MATTQTTRIGPADHGRRMTPAEFRDADEQGGYRYELAGGVLEVSEVPNDPHRQVVDNLREAVSAYRRAHPGRILCIGGGSEFQLEVADFDSERHPDLGIVFVGTPKDARGRRQPTWVAEVVSPGPEARRRDHELKRQEYLSYGIEEYWIVDPKSRRVTVLVRDDSGPAWRERTFEGDEAIVGPLLPGFEGAVDALWRDAETDD